MTKTATVDTSETLVDAVKARYGRIAKRDPERDTEQSAPNAGSSCCAPSCCGEEELVTRSDRLGYSHQELESVPKGADLGLGCGAPLAALKLQPGETVLDLGAGGGLDAFVASPLVGERGRVVGVDMTPEMVERARRNASEGGYSNVEFRQGRLESLPLGDAEIDAITSNCVVNLVPDKQAVFREAFRVLKPGGRIALSDIVLDGPLPEAIEKSINAYVGCISGATPRDRYFEIVKEVGFTDVEILNDVNVLEKLGGDLPPDARERLEETGLHPDEIRGTVRSVTFRAHKPE